MMPKGRRPNATATMVRIWRDGQTAPPITDTLPKIRQFAGMFIYDNGGDSKAGAQRWAVTITGPGRFGHESGLSVTVE